MARDLWSLAVGGACCSPSRRCGSTSRCRAAATATFEVRRALGGYVRVIRSRVSIGYIARRSRSTSAALFAYVSGSSLVLIGVLGVSRRVYGVLFAVTALGLMIGALTNARLSRRASRTRG